jgi:homoserine O-acetyltransferase
MSVTTLDSFRTEKGVDLNQVPVAWKAWGRLNASRDNVVIVCHALTGNTDVDDWWAPLLGPGRVLDTDHFFVICFNVAGSPYGSVSPVTTNPDTGEPYGVTFPDFSIRDTVALHRRVLDDMDISGVELAIGASMGGMQVLEWGFHTDLVKALCPIAVGGRHSAWCIAWSASQRQAIISDPKWKGGCYPADDPPAHGLSVARMMAMISYRSQSSFEKRFGRARMKDNPGEPMAVESYLQYQGEKLVARFDANCYIALTRQMDSHDVACGRGTYPEVLKDIKQPTLVVGIDSDILYPLAEQHELVQYMPSAEMAVLTSPDGHDAFLIDFEQLSAHLRPWMAQVLSEIDYRSPSQSEPGHGILSASISPSDADIS